MQTMVERSRSGRARGEDNRVGREDIPVESLGATVAGIRVELGGGSVLPADRYRLGDGAAGEGRS